MFYTDRQVAVLEFLQRYKRLRGVSPTLEEMAENFGVSKVTVHDHVRQLEKKGAIRKVPHMARALEILDEDYLDTYGIGLLAGRNFSADRQNDASEGILLNAAAVRTLG